MNQIQEAKNNCEYEQINNIEFINYDFNSNNNSRINGDVIFINPDYDYETIYHKNRPFDIFKNLKIDIIQTV